MLTWQNTKLLPTLLQAILTEVKGLRADIERYLTMTNTVTTTLAQALADEHAAVQIVLADNAAKQTTIDSLNKQAKDKEAELATAKANAATPEQIAQIEADALALRTAAQVVSQQPVQTSPDPTTAAPDPTTVSGSPTMAVSEVTPQAASTTTTTPGSPPSGSDPTPTTPSTPTSPVSTTTDSATGTTDTQKASA